SISASRKIPSMPASIAEKNQRLMVGTTTATRPVMPLDRREASGETTYESSSASFLMRSRVRALTPGMSRRARETVAGETPASRATSAILMGAVIGVTGDVTGADLRPGIGASADLLVALIGSPARSPCTVHHCSANRANASILLRDWWETCEYRSDP